MNLLGRIYEEKEEGECAGCQSGKLEWERGDVLEKRVEPR
jgi:hypothetical protein